MYYWPLFEKVSNFVISSENFIPYRFIIVYSLTMGKINKFHFPFYKPYTHPWLRQNSISVQNISYKLFCCPQHCTNYLKFQSVITLKSNNEKCQFTWDVYTYAIISQFIFVIYEIAFMQKSTLHSLGSLMNLQHIWQHNFLIFHVKYYQIPLSKGSPCC